MPAEHMCPFNLQLNFASQRSQNRFLHYPVPLVSWAQDQFSYIYSFFLSSNHLLTELLKKTVTSWRKVQPRYHPPRPQCRLTCPWTGSTASARSCVSRGDLSGLPAAPADELCSDEAAAKSLTSQTSVTWEAP